MSWLRRADWRDGGRPLPRPETLAERLERLADTPDELRVKQAREATQMALDHDAARHALRFRQQEERAALAARHKAEREALTDDT